MAKSMTGFGRSIAEYQGTEFTLEVRTLNHRYLDMNMRLPRTIGYLEEDIRSLIKGSFNRGRVEVYIGISEKGDHSGDLKLNHPLLKSYMACFEELKRDYGLDGNVSMDTLIGIDDIFIMEEREQDEDALKNILLEALEEAVERVEDMRIKEGQSLAEDIRMRGGCISEMVGTISEKSYLVVEEYREKLKDRLSELVGVGDLDENRFNMEIALMAERSNITEEIVRLRSHITQLVATLDGPGPMGRKLDFLVQEMNREANTIGSKSGDLGITNMVVDIKSEIEKIREQVQNIE